MQLLIKSFLPLERVIKNQNPYTGMVRVMGEEGKDHMGLNNEDQGVSVPCPLIIQLRGQTQVRKTSESYSYYPKALSIVEQEQLFLEMI